MISPKHLGRAEDMLHQMWQTYHFQSLVQHRTALITPSSLLRCFIVERREAQSTVYVISLLMVPCWNMCKQEIRSAECGICPIATSTMNELFL